MLVHIFKTEVMMMELLVAKRLRCWTVKVLRFFPH